MMAFYAHDCTMHGCSVELVKTVEVVHTFWWYVGNSCSRLRHAWQLLLGQICLSRLHMLILAPLVLDARRDAAGLQS